MMQIEEAEDAQILIRFVTKQQHYAVPDTALSVPSKIDCNALNNLINELLRENNVEILKPVEFDFLIFSELIRTPLKEHIDERNISTEATVEVEYIERTPAPEPQDSLLHDDWVSGLHVTDDWILTGCYDNTVNLWTSKGKLQFSLQEHTNVVKAVSWLKRNDKVEGFVSASHDLTAILWEWEPNFKEAKPRVVLRGHERGIDSVAVCPNVERLATGGWDTHLKLWSTSFDYEVDEPANKKIKGLFTRTPLHTLQGHKESISSVVWLDPHVICSASMDHTIKIWDAELYGLKNEIVGQKAFLGVSWSPLSKTLIACSADRHIRLYDPRSIEGVICKTTFTSHTLWVSSVAWSNYSEYLFLSGSYDESVKMWDTRSPKAPLYNLTGHQGKILCVDWSNNKLLVSGGTDNSVHIFKNNDNE